MKPFFLDLRQWFGTIATIAELRAAIEAVRQSPPTVLDPESYVLSTRHGETYKGDRFGRYGEYRGETLREWLAAQGIEL